MLQGVGGSETSSQHNKNGYEGGQENRAAAGIDTMLNV